MPTKCFIPILGKRLRATKLDACGALPAAAAVDSSVTTDGFITVTLSTEVEDGAEIIVKKASGALCVNEKQSDSFKRFTVEIEFCGVNPALIDIMTNATGYNDWIGDKAGFKVAEGEILERFALELWTGLSGAACVVGASTTPGGYLLLPHLVGGVLGDITIDGENAVTFSVSGIYSRGGNAWGVGPYLVLNNGSLVPSALPTALDPNDHLLLMDTSLAPPPVACSPVPMPPYVLTVTPATGGIAGGTAVIIRGSGFTGATAVTFGGTAGTAFSVVNDTQINVTTPAKSAGAYTVLVDKPTGTDPVLVSGFTYV